MTILDKIIQEKRIEVKRLLTQKHGITGASEITSIVVR